MGSTSTILILTLVGVALVLVITFVSLRKAGAFGMSRAKEVQAVQLMQTGRKARAMIMGVQPTGMVVNNINIQCIVTFRLEPLDGSTPFDAQKKMLVSQTAMPRIGETWPSWFDPSDQFQFAVGQPTAITPDQVGLFREFGIPHPLDRPLS
ncbi:MAG: hypothetical protein JWM12_623 [Ilumatobacteraceae bacterium]|nr:hypothetical protein [Ilumatobacteraceae bacterium]